MAICLLRRDIYVAVKGVVYKYWDSLSNQPTTAIDRLAVDCDHEVIIVC
jgi:hypothetical protein